MGWILERFRPRLVAAVDLMRTRGTGLARLAALDAGGYAAVFAFGAGRRRLHHEVAVLAQIARILGEDGLLILGDFVPGAADRTGQMVHGSGGPRASLAEVGAGLDAGGLEILACATDDADLGRVILARAHRRRA